MSTGIPPTIRLDIAGAADAVLLNSSDRVLVVTPLVFQPSDGLTGRVCYFAICSCSRRRGFYVLKVTGDEADRIALVAALGSRKRIVIHIMDDELQAARLCETLWPCERTSRLRAAVEAERAVGGAP